MLNFFLSPAFLDTFIMIFLKFNRNGCEGLLSKSLGSLKINMFPHDILRRWKSQEVGIRPA